MWKLKNFLKKSLITFGSISSFLLIYDYFFNYATVTRNLRALKAATEILIDYKWRFDPEKLSELHTRVANRILYVCQKNGGLYIKLGQGIAAMNHVLPPEYNKILSQLYDKAPSVPYQNIEKIFLEDLKIKPENIFLEFEKEPIASASIAQVHRAILKDGTPVAVKVQKPYIRKQLPWDLFFYKCLVFLHEKAFDLPMYWSVDFTQKNLRKEADFINEAKNSEKCYENLPNKKNFYVPKVYWDYTTSRILTAEWIDGVKLNDLESLKKMNINVKDALKLMVEVFAHQIFISGFVHADPHPGNLLIRKQSNGKPQLIILDHGLYVEETEQFRHQYCELWKAMVLLDKQKLISICKQWGITDFELFATIQLMKPYNFNKAVHLQNTTKKDILKFQLQAKERIKHMLKDTSLIPRELIFVGRCLNLVRSQNKEMGSPINRINIFAYYAAKGTKIIKNEKSSFIILSWNENFHIFIETFFFEFRLFIIQTFFIFSKIWNNINIFFGKKVYNFEESIEVNTKQTLEEQLGFKLSIDEK